MDYKINILETSKYEIIAKRRVVVWDLKQFESLSCMRRQIWITSNRIRSLKLVKVSIESWIIIRIVSDLIATRRHPRHSSLLLYS